MSQFLVNPMIFPLESRYEAIPPNDGLLCSKVLVCCDKSYSAYSERVTKHDKTVRLIYEPIQ
ncbi:hypothetical protein [Streptococcus pluranimalium]|uniref:hypothetical protein n=1 Tax=Streptococcus pluranimalium TaxID=82348 RepID=UPI0039FD9505